MTERELLSEVIRLAGRRGSLALHVPDHLARCMGAEWTGFPDLMIIGDNGVMFAELKADGRAGQLRTAQRQFRNRVIAAGGIWATWSPADLRAGTITEALDDLAIG